MKTEQELRQAPSELEEQVQALARELDLTRQRLLAETEGRQRLEEELRQEKDKLAHLTRLYTMLIDVNKAIVCIWEPEDIYQQLCRIAVEEGLFMMAWVGLVDPDSLLVKPVAFYGLEEEYLQNVTISAADIPEGRGPAGTAIRTGSYAICNDWANALFMSPWKEQGSKRGYCSSAAFPLRQGRQVIGAFNLYAGEPHFFTSDRIRLLETLSEDLSFALTAMEQDKQRRRAKKELVETLQRLQQAMEQIVIVLGAALEMRDPYTAGHQKRVTDLSCAIAKELRISPLLLEGIRVAALIHDIGKIYVPAEILSKPGKLTPKEMNLIREHCQAGYDILKGVEFPWPIGQILLQHHERLDGSGYPGGLTDHDILLEAKIIAVADVVEAMASHRPYRAALGMEKALEEITQGKGVLYAPEVADACVRLFKKQGFTFSV